MTAHTEDRESRLTLCLSKNEKAFGIEAAKRCGISLSELVRRLLSIWVHCFCLSDSEPPEDRMKTLSFLHHYDQKSAQQEYSQEIQDTGLAMLVELLYSKAHKEYQALSQREKAKKEKLIFVNPFAAHPSFALPKANRSKYDLSYPTRSNKSGMWYGEKRFIDELIEWNNMSLLERLRWDFRRIDDSQIAKV
jgi:hypothetical protein